MSENISNLGDDLKMRIYDAALRLFASEGHHAVAVPRIADEAQVGVGSIYRVAKSKQALADDLYDFWQTEFNTFVLQTQDMTGDNCEQDFCRHWARVAEWVYNNPVPMRFLIMHKFTRSVGYDTEPAALLELRNMLSTWVAVGIRSGQIQAMTPATFAAIIRGPVIMLVLDNFLTRENLAETGALIWRSIRTQP